MRYFQLKIVSCYYRAYENALIRTEIWDFLLIPLNTHELESRCTRSSNTGAYEYMGIL